MVAEGVLADACVRAMHLVGVSQRHRKQFHAENGGSGGGGGGEVLGSGGAAVENDWLLALTAAQHRELRTQV
jgi:hypothetical protein